MIRRNLRSREMKFPAKKRNKANLHRDRNSHLREVIYKSHDFANCEFMRIFNRNVLLYFSVQTYRKSTTYQRNIMFFVPFLYFFFFFFVKSNFQIERRVYWLYINEIVALLSFKIKYSFYHPLNILKVEFFL